MSDNDTKLRCVAAHALRHCEPTEDVLKALVSGIADPEREVRSTSLDTVRKLNQYPSAIRTAVVETAQLNSIVGNEAASMLEFVGDDAIKAVPNIIARMGRDGDFWGELHKVIVKIGANHTEVANALVDALERHDPEKDSGQGRLDMIRSLGKLRPTAVRGRKVLMDCACDCESVIREAAVTALGNIGAGAKEVISLLEARIRDDNAQVREAARIALTKVRETAE
jgi:hypothetical protein